MKHKLLLQFGTLGLIILIGVTLWGSQNEIVSAKNINQDAPLVDPALLAKAKTDEPLDYLIYFKDQADLSDAYELPWEARGWFVYNTLMEKTGQSQAKVRKYLDETNTLYEAYWIKNAIAVQGSASATLFGLMNYGEIHSLQSIPRIFIADTTPYEPHAQDTVVSLPAANLLHIRADQAWSLGYDGTGIVVGSIDTGVRYTHDALVGAYRGNLGDGVFNHNYHWWDAVDNQPEPYDDHGHGSHVNGIMVGSRSPGEELGVAPGASWIACKAVREDGSGLGTDFIKCGQFMMAPTNLDGLNPNPNLRPQVVNNSWGDCGRKYDDWYESVIDAWLAAGIYPVFANGNLSSCGYDLPTGLNTVSNPARSPLVTAVGSTGQNDGAYAEHSAWGPTDQPDTINPNGYPLIKPQVVAPGMNIPSAFADNDTAYAVMSGSSMAAPHVAGLVGLMWEAGSCLMGDYATTETLLQESAVPIPYDTGNGDEGPGLVPNHATGWGEIDALNAVKSAISHCNGGFIDGYILDGVDLMPIAGANLQAISLNEEARTVETTSDEHGYYRLFIDNLMEYKITITAYGYEPGVVKAAVVPELGGTATLDINLLHKTNQVSISGVVGDGSGQSYPLYARITLEASDYSQTVFTNPFDGSYEFIAYDDVIYNLIIAPIVPGYHSMIESEISFSQSTDANNYLLEIAESCSAPGYAWVENTEEAPVKQECRVVPGGVLAGLASNKHSGTPLADVIIKTENGRVETVYTPEDPNLEDGFYWLFLPLEDNPQRITLSASKSLYLEKVVEIELHRNAANRYDLQLVSYLNHIGLVVNNLSLMVWDYAQGLISFVQGYLPR